ncbi:hypothetical protein [Bacillus cereus]|uniref:hypothetical protein n=1 Tax=Bacillus cereus TaxID=1396 RepID=UPI000BF3484C|nr:hypothetical protein [Bacillus cereus]PER25444.1 hypothetical protein CN476_12905 [Bacillus cereus]
MIFIKFKSKEDTTIEFIHHAPYDPIYGLDKTEEELMEEGLLMEELPVPELQPGKYGVLYYTDERGLYYEYVDVELTEADRIKQQQEALEQENKQLGQQVSDLEIQLLQKDQENAALGQQVSQLEIDAIQKDNDTNAIARQVSEIEIKQMKSDNDVAAMGQQVSELEIEVLKLQPTGGTN